MRASGSPGVAATAILGFAGAREEVAPVDFVALLDEAGSGLGMAGACCFGSPVRGLNLDGRGAGDGDSGKSTLANSLDLEEGLVGLGEGDGGGDSTARERPGEMHVSDGC